MNTLGHISKHKLQHAIISCIEAYVNETYLNEYEMFKQHRADNILKAEATHMISIINSNFEEKK